MRNLTNRSTISFATLLGLILITSLVPEPAAAQFTAAQKAACGSDAKRFCAKSMSSHQKLSACMQTNASKLSDRCRAAMS